MSSPAKLFERLVTAHRPGILFALPPHQPRIAACESKRSRRSRERAIMRRQQRELKAVFRGLISA